MLARWRPSWRLLRGRRFSTAKARMAVLVDSQSLEKLYFLPTIVRKLRATFDVQAEDIRIYGCSTLPTDVPQLASLAPVVVRQGAKLSTDVQMTVDAKDLSRAYQAMCFVTANDLSMVARELKAAGVYVLGAVPFGSEQQQRRRRLDAFSETRLIPNYSEQYIGALAAAAAAEEEDIDDDSDNNYDEENKKPVSSNSPSPSLSSAPQARAKQPKAAGSRGSAATSKASQPNLPASQPARRALEQLEQQVSARAGLTDPLLWEATLAALADYLQPTPEYTAEVREQSVRMALQRASTATTSSSHSPFYVVCTLLELAEACCLNLAPDPKPPAVT